MPNEVFDAVVEELNFVGEILSIGITKKGVINEGADPETVTVAQMKAAINGHIINSLHSFISKKKANDWRLKMMRKLDSLGENR